MHANNISRPTCEAGYLCNRYGGCVGSQYGIFVGDNLIQLLKHTLLDIRVLHHRLNHPPVFTSTTKSTSLRLSICSLNIILSLTDFPSCSVSLFFPCYLEIQSPTNFSDFFKAAALSMNVTLRLATRLATRPMPVPIWPAPTIPIFVTWLKRLRRRVRSSILDFWVFKISEKVGGWFYNRLGKMTTAHRPTWKPALGMSNAANKGFIPTRSYSARVKQICNSGSPRIFSSERPQNRPRVSRRAQRKGLQSRAPKARILTKEQAAKNLLSPSHPMYLHAIIPRHKRRQPRPHRSNHHQNQNPSPRPAR